MDVIICSFDEKAVIKLFGGSLETRHHSRGPQPPPTATLKPLLYPSLDPTPTLSNEHDAVDTGNGGPCRGNTQLLDWVGKHIGPETSHDPSPDSAGSTLGQVSNICMAGECNYHVYGYILCVPL